MNTLKRISRVPLAWLAFSILMLSAGVIFMLVSVAKSNAQPAAVVPEGTHGVLLEYWLGLGDSSRIDSLTRSPDFPLHPSGKMLRMNFQGLTDFGDCYGTRMRAWLTPPVTGDYTFWIAADDTGELWLSRDDNPTHKRRIATASFISAWNTYPEQRSAPIRLEAGKAYYIEALHKQGIHRNHVAVAWQMPGSNGPEVIPGRYLTPYNGGLGGEGITREVWTNISGVAVADLTASPAFGREADVQEQVAQFEAPSDWGDNYGQRLRGYIHPPTNGIYTFWVAADESAVLTLGLDDTPAQRREIARVTVATGPREWGRYAEQRSEAIYLEGGKTYYIEALQKEGTGPDHLAVAWQLPDGTVEGPIPATRLTPYDTDGDGLPDWYEQRECLDRYNPDDAAEDADFDGVSNLAEFQRGTQVHFDEVHGVWRGMLLEYWLGLDTSTAIESLTSSTNFPLHPSGKMLRVDFEAPTDFADCFGARMRGWVVPPVTGDYTFWIAVDDAGELWLSGDDKPAHKRRIAYATSYYY